VTDELRRFSHSLISTYLDCPRKAEFRYVEEVPSPKTAALVKGSACDSAWNRNLEQKIESGEDLAMDELKQLTEEAFRADVKEQGGKDAVDWNGSDARSELDSALRLTEEWRLTLAPAIQPKAVQVRCEKTLPSGRTFIGFIDALGFVNGERAVIDNKTGKRRLSEKDADKSLQPYAYAWLREKTTPFVFARAIDTGKTQSSEFVWTRRTQGDINWYGELVADVERAFETGVFPANPTSNLCGATWCPFFERCQPHRVTR
jgi:CRISPR/Cas system-associated exonuclease Cas4 (RecB family)